MRGASTPRLIAEAFDLYRRYPLLFLVLAAAVIVPFELIELAATGGDALTGPSTGVAAELVLPYLYVLVAVPLVSALHVHAVADIRVGEEPRLKQVAKRGAAALPVVCAATFVSWLGFFGGLLLFVIPGIYIWIRWSLVAQAAAIERGGWTTAMRRSWSLTEGHWFHVFVFFICIVVIEVAPGLLLGLALDNRVAIFLAGTALEIVFISFTALATALLYYDLCSRREALAVSSPTGGEQAPTATGPSAVDHGVDPRLYSDESRPNGWYVDPEKPDHMSYWNAAEPPGWGGRTRTPRKLRRQWDEENG